METISNVKYESDLHLYPHPYVTSDILLFSMIDNKLALYLTRRRGKDAEHPDCHEGIFTCQGSFIHQGETPEATVERVINTKIGQVSLQYLEQLRTYLNDKDTRVWAITIAYLGITNAPEMLPNTDEHAWFTIEETSSGIWLTSTFDANTKLNINQLVFKHDEMLKDAIERMQGKIEYRPIALHFTRAETGVTIPELKAVYQAILGKYFNSNNFTRDVMKKQFLDTGILQATRQTGKLSGAGKPPIIYKLTK